MTYNVFGGTLNLAQLNLTLFLWQAKRHARLLATIASVSWNASFSESLSAVSGGNAERRAAINAGGETLLEQHERALTTDG